MRPFNPPLPAGSYDPALDAQRRAATRGLGDVRQDISTGNVRDTVDYGLGREDILRDQRIAQEDYDRNRAMLQQSFQSLANRQRQQAAAAGVLSGGIALEAARKRAAAQAQQQQVLDVGKQRFDENISTALGRLALELAPPGEGGPLGGRRFQDRATQLTRAEREDSEFGIDIEAQKQFSAAQSGYVPPRRRRRRRRA